MIAPQLGRAARATSHNTICTAQRTATCTRPAIANSLCLAHRPHQRRLSSSKASCPPDDGKDGSSAATSTNKTAHAARSQAVRGTGPRPTRSRKSKDAESQFKQDKVDAVFDKLPKVPSTNDMRMQRSGMLNVMDFCKRVVTKLIGSRYLNILFFLVAQTDQSEQTLYQFDGQGRL